jgi:hypothetical protein
MRQRKHQRCRLLCLLSTLLAASLLVVDGGIESFFVPQGDTSSNAGEPATFFLLATRMPPEFNQYSCQVQIIWPHLSPFRVVYMSVSYMQLLQTCCKSNRNRTPMRRCEILSQVRSTCSFRVHQYHCLSCCLIGARIHVLNDEQAAANTPQIQPESSPGTTLRDPVSGTIYLLFPCSQPSLPELLSDRSENSRAQRRASCCKHAANSA